MLDSSTKKISRLLLYFLGAVILFYVLYLLSDLMIILAVAILLAFIFDPFVTIFEKEGFTRFTSTSIVFIAVALLLYFGLSVFIPKFLLQMNQFIAALHVKNLHEQILSLEQGVYKYVPIFKLGDLSNRIESFLSSGIINSFDKISTLLTSIFSIVILVVIVPIITFFLLKDSQTIMNAMLHIVPNNYFELSYWIIKRVSLELGKFVRGWIFDALFVGISCGFGYHIIGVQNALPLGLISGLGHLVPYFGPIIGGVPAIVISVIQYGNFSHVPYICLMILIVYALDNGFVQPYVLAKSVDMHPIVIIILILAGSELFGVIGMLLAIPFATVVRTASKEIYFALKNYKIARL
jgi:predicted PurR-regulated permease PerM